MFTSAVGGVVVGAAGAADASSAETADYRMDVTGTLTTGDWYVDRFGYHDNYTFYGESGDNVTAALRQTVGEDENVQELQLWLVAPSGEIETSESLRLKYDPYQNISVDTALDETGTYTLVAGTTNDDPNFDYRLRLRERLATADTVAYGDRVDGAVTATDAFSDGAGTGGDDLPVLRGYHDVYAFDGVEGDNVTAELRQTVGEDETAERLVLKMIAPSGEVETVEQLDIEYDPYQNISVDTSLDETGTYRLVVTGGTVTGTFDYELRFHRPFEPNEAIAYGDRVSGAITKSDAFSVYSGSDRDDIPVLEGYHDVYTFEGEVGENVTAELRQTTGTDEPAEPILLKLVGPDGGIEAVDQHDLEYDAYQNVSVDTSLDANGTYRLVVSSARVTDTFDYELRFHRPFEPNEAIAYGDRVSGAITKSDAFSVYSGSDRDDIPVLEGYHDVYTFEGEVGDNVTAELRQTTGTDEPAEPILLKLVGPDGGIEAVDQHDLEYDAYQNVSVDTSLDANGTYRLVVTSARVTDTFDYQLRLHRSLATGDSLAYGDRVSGAITKSDAFSVYSGSDRDDIPVLEGYHDIYTFEGEVGENVTAELRQTTGTDEPAEPILLKLVAPSGEVEAVEQHDLEYDPNLNISLDSSLDETGIYRLVVTSAEVTDTFDYRLRLHERLATNETLAYGDRVTGAVTTADDFSDVDGTDDGLPTLDGYHDVYAVEGEAGENVSAVLEQTGSGSAEAITLKLVAPSGDLEAVDQYDLQYDSDNSVGVDTALEETGRYKLVVEGIQLTDTFEYALNVTGPAPEPTTPPTAALSVSPATATVGETVTFEAEASTDTDGSVVEYAWDFDGDGTVDRTTTTATVTHDYGASGDYAASVTVTDGDGLTDSTSETVTVEAANQIPDDAVYEPGSVAAEFDADTDGRISIGELATAAETFASGELRISGLATIAEAFAAS
ncbi:PKD domain-containing protein [Halosimplex litoreum]|uniref:PKD domain-containing protein n=1 Tax=Halosimplex litoreum TaxID=1198301 RepID=A0A7T3KTR5_9EURY|nr:PKD domain-containing protein [Halosimplex litoreum]QPV61512.1 PKD domain-containing protein [Halosimplex litoreum]